MPNSKAGATSSTGRSTPAPTDAKLTSIYAETSAMPDTSDNDDTNNSQSMNKSKTNFGESFYNKQNKIKEQKIGSPSAPSVVTTTTANSVNCKSETQQQQPQTKSSRRTTSLLNLFMSNSQGNSSQFIYFSSVSFHFTLFFFLYTHFFPA